MDTNDIDYLIHLHLDGSLTEEAAKALSARLVSDAAARKRLIAMSADHVRLHNLLQMSAVTEADRQINAQLNQTTFSAKKSRRWTWYSAAAALFAAAVTIFVLHDAGAQIESGEVLVNEQRASVFQDGSLLKAVGEAPATLRLADGSRIELSAESEAVVKGPSGGMRQVIQILRGDAKFKVARGNGKFRVETPAGNVTVLGTEFTLSLWPAASEGFPEIDHPELQAMQVSVQSGSVEVESEGRMQTLNSGDVETYVPNVTRLVVEPVAIEKNEASTPAFVANHVAVTGRIAAITADSGGDPAAQKPRDKRPVSLSIMTTDNTVYNISLDSNSIPLAHRSGEIATVSGVLYERDGEKWLLLDPRKRNDPKSEARREERRKSTPLTGVVSAAFGPGEKRVRSVKITTADGKVYAVKMNKLGERLGRVFDGKTTTVFGIVAEKDGARNVDITAIRDFQELNKKHVKQK